MLRTLLELHSIKPGFDASNVLSMRVSIPADKFPSPSREINCFHEVLHRVRALPGVRAAGTSASLPLGGGGSHQPFSIEGRPVLPMAEQPEVDVRTASTGYLNTMHIPVIRGRDFIEADQIGRRGAAPLRRAPPPPPPPYPEPHLPYFSPPSL